MVLVSAPKKESEEWHLGFDKKPLLTHTMKRVETTLAGRTKGHDKRVTKMMLCEVRTREHHIDMSTEHYAL